MKDKIYRLMETLKNKNIKVVRFDKSEFELENGEVYPHLFELSDDITIDDFQTILEKSKQNMIDFLDKVDE